MALNKKQVKEIAGHLDSMSKAFYSDDKLLKIMVEIKLLLLDCSDLIQGLNPHSHPQLLKG